MARFYPCGLFELPPETARVANALALILLGLFAMLPSQNALAAGDNDDEQTAYNVLVLPYASIHKMLPAQVGEKTTQFLKTEIRGTDGVRLAKLKRNKSAGAVLNPTPVLDQSKLNRAKQSAAEAKSALEMGEFTSAISSYHAAIDIEREQHPHIDFNEFREQYIGLAIASFQLGEEDEGQRYLEAAARLDTTKKIDAKSMPPVFVRAFNQALRRIKNLPTAALDVECTIPGADVFLNGRKIGKTPLRREDLPPGTHYLKVVPKDDSTVWAQTVDLVSSQVVRINARIDLIGGALADIERELSGNRLTALAADRAVDLANDANATHVVLGGVHQERDGIAMTSFLISVGDRTVCPLESALFDSAMMGAGIELYKVGADLVRKLKTCDSPRKLPTPLAPNAPGRSAQSASVRTDALANYQAYIHSPQSRHSLNGSEQMEDVPRRARLETPQSAIALDDEPGSGRPWTNENMREVKEEKRNLTWLWITLGVVAAAGLATGGYLIYDANNSPEASGTIHWAI